MPLPTLLLKTVVLGTWPTAGVGASILLLSYGTGVVRRREEAEKASGSEPTTTTRQLRQLVNGFGIGLGLVAGGWFIWSLTQ